MHVTSYGKKKRKEEADLGDKAEQKLRNIQKELEDERKKWSEEPWKSGFESEFNDNGIAENCT